VFIKRFLFIIILFIPCHAFAANWYCSNASQGSNNGTSWTNAWALTGVVWGGAGVNPGDTLYIDGGSSGMTYTATANSMLAVGVSGTNVSQITIATGALSPYPSGHSGKVVFDGNALYYWLIDCVPSAQGGQTYSGYVTINGNDGNGNQNLELYNTLRSADSGGNQEAAIFSKGGPHDGNKLLYVQIDSIADGVQAQGPYTFEVGHVSVTNLIGDHNVRVTGGINSAFGNILIHDSLFSIMADPNQGHYGPDGIQGSTGIDVYNCTFIATSGTDLGIQHPDCIQWDFDLDRAWNNYFYGGNAGVNSAMFGNFSGAGPAQIRLQVFNNIIDNFSASGIAITAGSGTTSLSIVIANNTFVDNYAANYPLGVVLGTVSSGSVVIENNIIFNTGSHGATGHPALQAAVVEMAYSSQESIVSFDYNDVNAGSTGSTAIEWWTAGSWSGNTWNVNTPVQTAISQANGQTGAPSFISYTVGSQSNNYRLSVSDTAAKSNGANLTNLSITPLDLDITGAQRPASGAWNIGAYQSTGYGLF
jgi:hypothetical protein